METKTCSRCHSEFPENKLFFSHQNTGKNGFRSMCRKCEKEYNRERNQRNKLKYTPVRKKWISENEDKYRQIKADWRKRNYCHNAEITKKWRQENPYKACVHSHTRSAKKKSVICNLTLTEWHMTIRYFNYRCAYCGKNEKLTQDHLIPLSKGGNYSYNNIIPACRFCNSSKHDKDLDDWYVKQSFYSEDRRRRIEIFSQIIRMETSRVNAQSITK